MYIQKGTFDEKTGTCYLVGEILSNYEWPLVDVTDSDEIEIMECFSSSIVEISVVKSPSDSVSLSIVITAGQVVVGNHLTSLTELTVILGS